MLFRSARSLAVGLVLVSCSGETESPIDANAEPTTDAGAAASGERVYVDGFGKDHLAPAFTWIREVPEAWRLADGVLELRVLPGNLWCAGNDAKNVLVHPLPVPMGDGELDITADLESAPSGQYEQVNLAYYLDDANMVKIGREVVDGAVCVVMGREEKDACGTLAKPAVSVGSVGVRLRIVGRRVRGAYRREGSIDWVDVGETDLPVVAGGRAYVSVHAYNGVAGETRWARVRSLRVTQRP